MPMAAVLNVANLETTNVGKNTIKQFVLTLVSIFILKNMLLTLKPVDKWPPRGYFEMLAMENSSGSKFEISINRLVFVIYLQ